MAEIVVFGPSGRESFGLARAVTTIGRSPACHIPITDRAASRKHCIVKTQGTGFVVVDMGSANGTIVNGDRIGEHELVDEDRIQIGTTVLVYHDD